MSAPDAADPWPSLPLAPWQDTRDTLHLWTQIVGKTRLALAPMVNHWWNVPFYVSARGLTTSRIPYRGASFAVEFDFIDHELTVQLAPAHPGGVPGLADRVTREAYSHTCISAGWWPGTVGSPVAEPAFYAYAFAAGGGAIGKLPRFADERA